MGTFSTFLATHHLSDTAILRTSAQLESATPESRAVLLQREGKRKKQTDKSYAELNLPKPRSGRGVSAQQLAAAHRDVPLPRVVRSKLIRVVGALVAKKQIAPVNHQQLFGATGAAGVTL